MLRLCFREIIKQNKRQQQPERTQVNNNNNLEGTAAAALKFIFLFFETQRQMGRDLRANAVWGEGIKGLRLN